MRRIFAGILCMGVLFTGAVPCSASAPLGYDEYGDPIVTATPVPDAQTADSSGQAAADTAPAHSSYYSQAADTDTIPPLQILSKIPVNSMGRIVKKETFIAQKTCNKSLAVSSRYGQAFTHRD